MISNENVVKEQNISNENVEILNIFENIINNYSSNSIFDFEDYEITYVQVKSLLDYITNLQSKIEAYELFDNQKIANLQEEIEELKANLYEANDSVTWWNNRYNAIVKQNDDNHKKLVKEQEENKNLKNEQISKYQTLKELQEENDKLEDIIKKDRLFTECRIDKAIEYIGNGNLGIPRKVREKFIKILEGEKQ